MTGEPIWFVTCMPNEGRPKSRPQRATRRLFQGEVLVGLQENARVGTRRAAPR
jgi:hypothetical protein